MQAVPSTAFVSATEIASARKGGASLDVLRFLAAGFILLYHYGLNAPVALDRWNVLFQQGWLATDFFLMLSGYILSRAYGERLAGAHMRRSHFFLRRFARLWPSHIVVLMTFGAFVIVSTAFGLAPQHGGRYSLLAFLAQAFLVHGWGMFVTPGWNIPTWTLSALLICYGMFSLYLPLLYGRSIKLLAASALIVLMAAHGVALGVAHHAFADLPFEWGLLRAIPLFILGNLVERATVGLRVDPRIFWGVIAGCLSAVIVLAQMPRNAIGDTVILAALATILMASGSVTFTESRMTQRMGRASFALFLTHSLVGAAWFGLSPRLTGRFALGAPEQWALWGVGIVLAIATAFAFDALVDKPLSARVSRLGFVRGERV